MAQSLSNVLLHLVFSTKNRQPLIDASIAPEVHAYLVTACKTLECVPIKVGGFTDHVHIACKLSRTVTIASLVQQLKQDSSKWIKSKGTRYASFAWQNGYGAFSIGHSQLEALKSYIANQPEHHRQLSFQDEFRKLLTRYGIEWDERYIWQ